MFLVVRVLIVAVLGAGLGLGSVWLALGDPRLDLTPRIGPWRVAAVAADPYAAARAARDGGVPLGPAEGVAFVAREDMAGRPLDPRCHYAVAGPAPAGPLWTLAVTDRRGHPPDNPAGRIGFTSRDVVREPDGRIEVVVGPTARPGNFVPAAGLADVELTLRVYGAGVASELPSAEAMPAVRLVGCTPAPAAGARGAGTAGAATPAAGTAGASGATAGATPAGTTGAGQ